MIYKSNKSAMRNMSGFEVCQKVMKNPVTYDIPIIFITAINSIGGMSKGFKVGAVDYITKPFDTVEVKTRIKTHLNLKLAKEALKNQNKILEEKVRPQ